MSYYSTDEICEGLKACRWTLCDECPFKNEGKECYEKLLHEAENRLFQLEANLYADD